MLRDRLAAFSKRLNPFFRRPPERDLDDELSRLFARCREVWTMGFLETLFTDVKYAVRALIRHRAFGVIAVLTLAIGIAANTATFSILYSVLLKPLSYPQPEPLVALFEKRPREGVTRNVVAPGDFVQWREQAQSFSAMAALEYFGVTYMGSDEPEQIRAAAVSPEYFRVAGIRPVLGREFASEEETPGKHQVVIATHAFWKRHLGGDAQIANLVPLQESMVGDVSKAIVFMSYAAAVLLLIACINAANLFLARSIARSREWRIRASIGAGRARLVRWWSIPGHSTALSTRTCRIAVCIHRSSDSSRSLRCCSPESARTE